MARNGSGTYTLPAGNPVVTGAVISSTVHNNTTNDLASEMTNSTDKDGQTVITGTWDFNGNKIVLDADGDSSITMDTDDILDIEIEGVDAIKIGHQKIDGGSFVDIDPKAVTLDAAESYHRVNIASSNAITVPAGTTTTVSSIRIAEPNITATGTLTNSATVYITGAASEATNNYAVWVDAGNVLVDEDVTVSGTLNAVTFQIGGTAVASKIATPHAYGKWSSSALQTGSSGITSIVRNSLGNYTVTLDSAVTSTARAAVFLTPGEIQDTVGIWHLAYEWATTTTITVLGASSNFGANSIAQDDVNDWNIIVYNL